MEALIKRFTQETSDLSLVSLSIASAITSIYFTQWPPVLQFTISVITAIILSTICLKSFLDISYNFLLALLSSVFSLILIGDVVEFLVIWMFISVLITPVKKLYSDIFLKAFLAHLAEAFATVTALSTLQEVNPLMKMSMRLIGDLPALLVSKIVLVGLPLYYSSTRMNQDKSILFAKIVYVVGLALFARILFFFLF